MTASEEKFTRQTLLEVQPLTPSLFTLRTSRDAAYRFRAGQFARLGVYKPSGSIVWRAYSMVSAPHDEFLDFFSIVVPGGEFTSELSRLREGDQLLVDRQAFGFLTLDRFVDGRDLWLLATGTGVAPFLSILQDFEVWERFESIKLVYSVREEKELAYRELIAGLGAIPGRTYPQAAVHSGGDPRAGARLPERAYHHADRERRAGARRRPGTDPGAFAGDALRQPADDRGHPRGAEGPRHEPGADAQARPDRRGKLLVSVAR